MSFQHGKRFVIQPEPARPCSACGKLKECRPYGKNGAQVCFGCAMSTPESKREAERRMAQRIASAEEVEIAGSADRRGRA